MGLYALQATGPTLDYASSVTSTGVFFVIVDLWPW